MVHYFSPAFALSVSVCGAAQVGRRDLVAEHDESLEYDWGQYKYIFSLPPGSQSGLGGQRPPFSQIGHIIVHN